jgi:uncharacterized protein (TIGR00730 family)
MAAPVAPLDKKTIGMNTMRVCVFCGSSPGSQAKYREVAQELGHSLAKQSIGLVYGGADMGLMGMVANAALEAGGEVIGVIPRQLVVRELAHHGLTDLRVVDDMQERKDVMAKLSNAFVCLPGGFGTMDELFEMVTWNQLGTHSKPCVLLDPDGFFDDLLKFLDRARDDGFIKPEDRDDLQVCSSVADLVSLVKETAKPRR